MENPRRTSSFTLVALAAASLAALSGCGSYISDYVPPDDGRARAVWRDGKVVMEGPGEIPAQCAADIGYAAGEPPVPYTGRSTVHVHGGFWVPVYYGPRIVVVHRHTAPPPPRFSATRVGKSSLGGGGGSGGSVVPVKGSGGGGGGSLGGSGSGSGGGGGGGDIGKGAVIVAVVALIALPAIALGLSLGRTEAEKETALVIDHVNAYNDLARTPGSPCAIGPWVAQP